MTSAEGSAEPVETRELILALRISQMQQRVQKVFSGLDILGGSGVLVSKVTSTLIGVISNYKYSYLMYHRNY